MCEENPTPGNVTDTQRNGSVTGIGIVLGFSLAFIAQWSFLPGEWETAKFVALLISIAGVFVQLIALIKVLYLPPMPHRRHNHSIRTFVVGVCLVLLGYGAHIFIDFWNDHWMR